MTSMDVLTIIIAGIFNFKNNIYVDLFVHNMAKWFKIYRYIF